MKSPSIGVWTGGQEQAQGLGGEGVESVVREMGGKQATWWSLSQVKTCYKEGGISYVRCYCQVLLSLP